jgi:hypothetical protein
MAEAAVVAPPNPEVIQPHHDVKLFNRWTFEDITVGFFFPISQWFCINRSVLWNLVWLIM